MIEPAFIVAEISKNCKGGDEAVPGSGLLSQNFEKCIVANLELGFVLHSWELKRIHVPPDGINETIIAVFRRLKKV